jgi:hypothetical protein
MYSASVIKRPREAWRVLKNNSSTLKTLYYNYGDVNVNSKVLGLAPRLGPML